MHRAFCQGLCPSVWCSVHMSPWPVYGLDGWKKCGQFLACTGDSRRWDLIQATMYHSVAKAFSLSLGIFVSSCGPNAIIMCHKMVLCLTKMCYIVKLGRNSENKVTWCGLVYRVSSCCILSPLSFETPVSLCRLTTNWYSQEMTGSMPGKYTQVSTVR